MSWFNLRNRKKIEAANSMTVTEPGRLLDARQANPSIEGSMANQFNKSIENLRKEAFSGNYNDLTNKPQSLPASDVYNWAKQPNKPGYNASEINFNQGNCVVRVSVADQSVTGVGAHWVKFARFTVTQGLIGADSVIMEYQIRFRRSPLKLEFRFDHVGGTDPGLEHYDFFDYAALYNNNRYRPAVNCISQNQSCLPGGTHLFLHHAGTSVYDLYVLKEIQWLTLVVMQLYLPQGVSVTWYDRAGEIASIPTSGVLFQIKCANANSVLFGS